MLINFILLYSSVSKSMKATISNTGHESSYLQNTLRIASEFVITYTKSFLLKVQSLLKMKLQL